MVEVKVVCKKDKKINFLKENFYLQRIRSKYIKFPEKGRSSCYIKTNSSSPLWQCA